MYGFEHNEIDPHKSIPVRTLKVLLRANLPQMYPILQLRIEQAFARELGNGKMANGTFETALTLVESCFRHGLQAGAASLLSHLQGE